MAAADRTLYAVIHGVGDPEPGDTVRELARGLMAVGGPAALSEHRLWLPEPDPTGADTRTARAFAVPVLRDDARGRTLAEVHWADLARFPVSLLGLVEGLFSILFGLRYIAYQAAHGHPGPGAAALRGLGRAIAALLIGPLAATNLLTLFLLGGAVAADRFAGPGAFGGPAGEVAAVVACVLAVGAGAALARRQSDSVRLIGRSLAWLAAGVLVAGLAAPRLGLDQAVWDLWGLRRLHGQLADAEVPTGGAVLFVAVTTVPMGLAFLPANALVVLAGLVFLARVARQPDPQARTSAVVAALLPFAMLFGWSLAIPAVWSLLGAALPATDPVGRGYRVVLDFTLPSLAFWYLLLAVLGLVGVGVAVCWEGRAARLRRAAPPQNDDGARLIVAPILLWVLAVGGVAVEAAVIARNVPLDPHAGLGAALEWWAREFKSLWGPALALALAAFPVLAQGVPYMRSALDLVNGVMTHFRFRFRDPPVARPQAAQLAAADPDDADRPEFYVRRAIEHRLAAVVRHFAPAAGDGACHLVVVSHSQGTMVAVEVLNDPELAPHLDRFASVRLVTMGSPFGHIYQHYFRHHYPRLGDAYWATLRARLAPAEDGERWLNLYRVDDYVGRVIDADGTGLVRNRPVSPNGHTGYWTDREVLKLLAAEGVV